MTERSYGNSWNSWVGDVVNVNDPDKEGRVQVRIKGQHDNTSNIPDSFLPWAKPAIDITNAAQNKMGGSPVGIIKGSVIGGYYLDTDRQIPVFTHTVAKAGDPASSGSTTNGQVNLVDGTNSTPIGGRVKTNAFVTRKGKNIKDDDSASNPPTEQKDSDGEDITANAKSNTKFGTNPTTGSINNPIGSILQQIPQVDPKNINSVLNLALESYQKIKMLNNVSSTGGLNNLLGTALGAALQQLGPQVLNEIGNFLPGSLSSSASQALTTALTQLGSGANIESTMSNIISASVTNITQSLSGGGLTSDSFNSLMQQEFDNIKNIGSQATIGTDMNSIMSNLSTVLPQIAQPLMTAIQSHIPQSVLNNQNITQALQKFAMAQAFLKSPEQGKKALAMQATSMINQNNIAAVVSNIQGLTTAAATGLQKLLS